MTQTHSITMADASDVSKTDKSSYYFFKSTPKELQQQYAPVPLKEGQALDFTPRVQTLHQSTLVKKDKEKKKTEEALKNIQQKQSLSFAEIRKNPYDFRDKTEKEAVVEPDKYEVGGKVVIHGLQKAAKYNDKLAQVLGDEKDGRYPVKIIELGKQLNVKRANLKLYRPVVCKEFTDLELEEGFRCTPELLFRALTDQDMVSKYTQSETKIKAEVDGKFAMFAGSLHGHYTAIKAPSKIEQKWRFSEWPDDHYSDVSIAITSPEYGITVLKLSQTGVPLHDRYMNRDVPAKVRKGWKSYVFDRIHKAVGFAKVDKHEYSKKKNSKEDSDDE